MTDIEAPERVTDLPLTEASGDAEERAQCMQLRVLSGLHAGAILEIAAGLQLHVGCDDDCDVLLRDCCLAPGEPVQVQWQQDRWSLQAAKGEGSVAPVSRALGSVALLGPVSITVCAAEAQWQTALAPAESLAPQEPRLDGDALVAAPQEPEPQLLPLVADAAAADDPQPAPGADARRDDARRDDIRRINVPATAWGLLTLAVLGGAWAAWKFAPDPVRPQAPRTPAAHAALSPQAQAQAVKEAGLAIALVDPALRLRIELNAEGRVTVSGWVDNVEQFDRLAQALSSLRPLPRLAVRTASEVLDALSDAGSAQGLKLHFVLQGAGQVQVRGIVTTPALRQQLLAQLRARAPEGIEVSDGLRVASEQGPAIRSWLQAQGLTVTRADWDGEQLLLGVEVAAPQRAVLERLLATTPTPLTDVPFLLQTRELKLPAEAPATRVRIGDAGLPLSIRSVVGGAAPYVVLADGTKLQPGGRHAGWQLFAVTPDQVVLDGPKRLEIGR